MTPSRQQRGFSIVEGMFAVAVTSIVVLVAAKSFSSISDYLRNASVRKEATSEANRAVATMIATLQKAKSKSVIICSCGSANCVVGCTTATPLGTPPNSRIEFKTIDNANPSAIYWEGGKAFFRFGGTTGGQIMADHVTGLLFSGDGTDFSHVHITLRMDVPITAAKFATVLLPNQVAVLLQ